MSAGMLRRMLASASLSTAMQFLTAQIVQDRERGGITSNIPAMTSLTSDILQGIRFHQFGERLSHLRVDLSPLLDLAELADGSFLILPVSVLYKDHPFDYISLWMRCMRFRR